LSRFQTRRGSVFIQRGKNPVRVAKKTINLIYFEQELQGKIMNKERLNPLNDYMFLKIMGEKGGRGTALLLPQRGSGT
jgi:hypothetical protein